MSAPLVFIDTETTGVHPDRQVWDVAMIRRDENGQREHQFFVEVDLGLADPFGLKVGRFYDRHPLGLYLSGEGMDPAIDVAALGERKAMLSSSQAAEEVARVTHGAQVVGAVPNFDAETLDPLLRRFGYLPAWHYHLIDVEALAVGYLHGRWDAEGAVGPSDVVPPWKSDDLSRACGVKPPSDEERHTALGDARWAMRLYDAITGHRGEKR